MKDLSPPTGVEARSSEGMLVRATRHVSQVGTDEIDRMRRFGETRRYAANELLFRTG